MSKTPKCPYCGDKMELMIVSPECINGTSTAWYQCVVCESSSPTSECPANAPRKEIVKKALTLALHRAEPKNRVLTLEELKNHAGFLWNENRYGSFDSEGEPAYVENDFLYAGNGNVDLKLNIAKTYGKHWRCWLRKPTKKEMEATPWGENRA